MGLFKSDAERCAPADKINMPYLPAYVKTVKRKEIKRLIGLGDRAMGMSYVH